VKMVILEPGMEFGFLYKIHWLKRFAIVSGIIQRRRATSQIIWTEFSFHFLFRKINSLEAIVKSGILSDREIELEHGRMVLLLPETKRMQISWGFHNSKNW
jgi:hypothetical protein